ncbi:MAG: chloramphenicol 3-O-phosphotransferase, partial [Candidatus Azotimanducaceae bacterium]
MAHVILLNGCSSAGKTTLAVKLQQLLPEPYQYI